MKKKWSNASKPTVYKGKALLNKTSTAWWTAKKNVEEEENQRQWWFVWIYNRN